MAKADTERRDWNRPHPGHRTDTLTMTDTDGCTLCDLPLGETATANDDGEQFCCRGCREVHATLADHDDLTVDADPEEIGTAADEGAFSGAEETTFLRIDGMHCATCETFVESRAGGHEGVSAVDASYITDTVRIAHEEDTSEESLRERLTGLGYRAYARGDKLGERRAEDDLFWRLVVGVLFGMMVMLNYVVLIYPTYFENGLYYAFVGAPGTAEFLAEMVAGTSATYFFGMLALLSGIVLFGTGGPILTGAYVSLRMREPNMDLLVALAATSAWLYSVVAMFLGETHVYYDVTVGIVLVVTAGSYYENEIKRTATEKLATLTEAQADEAHRVGADGATETVPVERLAADDTVLVREGERVPVDGQVMEGEGTVDEAVVTGESLPVPARAGDEVVGGSVLQEGSLVVAVGPDATSSVDRITDTVWNLQSATHGIQQLADRLATVFVPVVFALAVVVGAVHLLLGADLGATLLVALTVLIVSCPCALGLATPLAIAASIRDALDRGIVVFDETIFERLTDVDLVVFDKTGTLTTGEMSVVEATGSGDTLRKAALLEARSAHPIAEAIATAYGGERPGTATTDGGVVDGAGAGGESGATGSTSAPDVDGAVTDFESFATGVRGVVDGTSVLVGHPDLFARQGWTVPARLDALVEEVQHRGNVPVVVGEDGDATGVVEVGDEPREGWEAAIEGLDARGVEVAILTGDDERAASAFGDHPDVDHVFAGVPPEGKAETVAQLGAGKETVMVGDGTNDAPALATADLGIALGSGTALAADAADVAIVTDDLGTLETVFDLAGAANSRVKQNIGWAFCYNGVAIPLAVTGLLNPLFAAVAMAASSLLVVSNSSRPLLAE